MFCFAFVLFLFYFILFFLGGGEGAGVRSLVKFVSQVLYHVNTGVVLGG